MELQIPMNETERINIVRNLLPTFEKQKQKLLQVSMILANFFKCSSAGISLVDSEKVNLIGTIGIDQKNFPRSDAFDSYTIIADDELVILPDISRDYRFSTSILLNGPSKINFYAAVPIVVSEIKVGTMFIMDQAPRSNDLMTSEQKSIFKQIGRLFSTAVGSMNTTSNVDCVDDSTELTTFNLTSEVFYDMMSIILNEIQDLFQSLMSKQDGFSSTMKLINSKHQSSETKQSMLTSIDEIQTDIMTINQNLTNLLKRSTILINSLKDIGISDLTIGSLETGANTTYVTANELMRLFKKQLSGSGKDNHSMFTGIKWDYDNLENYKCEVNHDLIELFAMILSVTLPLQFLRWKNVTINFSMLEDPNDPKGNGIAGSESLLDGLVSPFSSPTKSILSNGNNSPSPSKVKKIPPKANKIMMEVTCFHRCNNSSSNGFSSSSLASSSNASLFENLFFLLDEMLLKLLEILPSGNYQKKITSSSEIIQFIHLSSFVFQPKSYRRSLFLRNSIVAIEEAIVSTTSSILGSMTKQDSSRSVNVKKRKESADITANNSIAASAVASPRGSGGNNNELDENIKRPYSASINSIITDATPNDVIPKPQPSPQLPNQQGPPQQRRRGSIITGKNKVKANIVSSIYDSLVTVASNANMKKSIIVPVASP